MKIVRDDLQYMGFVNVTKLSISSLKLLVDFFLFRSEITARGDIRVVCRSRF
jgi:hypothetical protein